jgi:hypothetical protein
VVKLRDMETRTPELPSLPPPPRAVTSLIKGFNSIAGNVAVILFPAALDIFLWLGPRLKIDTLLAPIIQSMPDIQSQVQPDQARLFTQFLSEFQNGLNLFTAFRTFPLGVFSLMSTNFSVTSPLGMRAFLNVSNWLAAVAIVLVLTAFGWVAGSLYFRSVSRVALKQNSGPSVFRGLLQSVLLSFVWMVFFFFANLPLLVLMMVLTMMDATVRTIIIIILSIPAIWVLLAIFYSFYGIFANAQNAFTSTRNSIRMLRFGLPPLGWFTMLIILISQSMDLLWRAAPPDSWMMGVGILGHAFVSTSLLAASFIFYRDLSVWIDTALQWFKNQNKSSARA